MHIRRLFRKDNISLMVIWAIVYAVMLSPWDFIQFKAVRDDVSYEYQEKEAFQG